ncbi:3-isopropylmalate dehydratase large subunit [Anaeromicropila populeti]|uniref:3-isopropylmalate dehydratase large subunit n=1 Tax=Anaeromicropila populeti TaxID=37658 RepID=A0A1I6HSI1_9FIRM|nr:3-isopropylmalate dehydratase large subunit [Anaeromicropila populeti]SFR57431.1 3-isopropylmalate/(R)-2-methylmalate dehydratase large subunit [Anaeromicropila populeti]
MGQTLIEKMISLKLGRDIYKGQSVFVPVDIIMGTDGTTPLALKVLEEYNINKIKNPEKIIFVHDHFAPPKDISTANLSRMLDQFAKKFHITSYKEDRGGICHVLLPELGIMKPYDIVVGADSHTCTYGGLGIFSMGIGSTDMACAMATSKLWIKVPETIRIKVSGNLKSGVEAKDLILSIIGMLGTDGANYRAIEFCGSTIEKLTIAERMTICNMVIECGAKAGIINIDKVTEQYYYEKGIQDCQRIEADSDANYLETYEVEAEQLKPQIGCPYSPANVRNAEELIGTKINQVVIGSCTNGRIEDFRIAYQYMKGKQVHKNVKLILVPGSHNVLMQMEEEGMLKDFIKSNAIISPPSCGPCMGGHMGVLADDQVGLYTTNRNFYGRNGSPSSKVYLSNVSIAALSAIEGEIQVPEVN